VDVTNIVDITMYEIVLSSQLWVKHGGVPAFLSAVSILRCCQGVPMPKGSCNVEVVNRNPCDSCATNPAEGCVKLIFTRQQWRPVRIRKNELSGI
jgi:hypothetical protein